MSNETRPSVVKLIDIYRNAPTAENLCKILIYNLECDFVLFAWAISKQYWYIGYIYDSSIEKQSPNTGWYLNCEPDESNIPIKHSKLCDVSSIKGTLGKVIYAKIVTRDSKSPRTVSLGTVALGTVSLGTVALGTVSLGTVSLGTV